MVQSSPLACDELAAIAIETWATVINLPLEVASSGPEGALLMSCVQIQSETDNYVVAIAASGVCATKLAAGMLQMATSDIGEQDRNDAFGELANILGGGVKARIPKTSSLSMPMVIEGSGISLTFPRCAVSLNACFRCADELLSISIYHQEAL